MAELRSGTYGSYYGSTYSTSDSLNQSQMEVNAQYITKYLIDKGWTKNAIAGMLGNLQVESALNPGRWQSDNVGNTSGGYGLVQWTPATNYLEWVSSQGLGDASTMDNNLARIIYELEHGLQWIATSEYNLSFEEFTKSTESSSYLASAFLKCYERAGVEVETIRQLNAISWFNYINSNMGGSVSYKFKKKRFKFVIFNKRRFT